MWYHTIQSSSEDTCFFPPCRFLFKTPQWNHSLFHPRWNLSSSWVLAARTVIRCFFLFWKIRFLLCRIWKGILMLSLWLILLCIYFPLLVHIIHSNIRSSFFLKVWLLSWADPGGNDQGGFHRNIASTAGFTFPLLNRLRTVFVFLQPHGTENVYCSAWSKSPALEVLEIQIRNKFFFSFHFSYW